MKTEVYFFVMLLMIVSACDSNKSGQAVKVVDGGSGGGSASCLVDVSQDDPAVVSAWNILKSDLISEIHVSDVWSTPEFVPGNVNSIGWEDSAYISSDGKKLYFQYFRGDLFKIEQILGGDSQYYRGPLRGVTPMYTSDIFVADAGANGFCHPVKFSYSVNWNSEWGVMRAVDGSWYHAAYNGNNVDVYRNGNLLSIPRRDLFREDNPHFIITPYGRELFFDSDDRDSNGLKIWVAREEIDGTWSNPVVLNSPIDDNNSAENQPFLNSNGILYFGSSREGKIGIWQSTRTGENMWSQPTPVVWTANNYSDSGSHVWGVGEPTLTVDGKWMYFVAIFKYEHDGVSDFDADILRIKKI